MLFRFATPSGEDRDHDGVDDADDEDDGLYTGSCATSLTTPEDTDGTVDVTLVDPEGDPLSYEICVAPEHGTAYVENGILYYTPDPGYNGPDTLTVCVKDPSGAETPVEVTIEVTPMNDPPVCADRSYTTDEDTAVSGDADCTDPDGDPLTYAPVDGSGPTHGTLDFDPATGDFTYTPDPGYNGGDSFDVEVCDESGDCVT